MIHLDDDDAQVVLGLLALVRTMTTTQAALPIPEFATTGASLTGVVDAAVAVLRSCDSTLSPEDRERQRLRVDALHDQIEAAAGGDS